MWIEFENRWLNVDQVVSINEDAKTISLSNGKEVQISEGGISTIIKHVKGLAMQKPKANNKALKQIK